MSPPEHRGDATDRILQAAIPGPQKLVLAGYLRHLPSGKKPAEGTAWPSIDLLCCYTSNGAKATARHRAALVASGVLVVVRIRPGNVPECRIDFDALAAAGCSERGASVAPGKRADHFGHDGGSVNTTDTPTRQNRFGHDDASGSVNTADEPSPRTLSKNPPHSLSTSDKPKADPAPNYLDPTGISDSLKASKVSKGAWDVFDHWRQRQARPSAAKLSSGRLKLINAGLADYSPEDLINVVRLAYDAPVGPHGLPESYVKPWRTDKAGRPGLEMLFRKGTIARNVEMAANWLSGPSQGSTTPVANLSGQAWQHILTFTQRGELAERINTGRLGPDPDEHGRRLAAVKAAGGFPAFRMLDQYTERRVRDAFVAAYNGGAA